MVHQDLTFFNEPFRLFDTLGPLQGGSLIGNVSPARMDLRWFLVWNCIAILSSLATPAQATAIMDLVEEHWEDLIGEMPLKIAFPAFLILIHTYTSFPLIHPKKQRTSP